MPGLQHELHIIVPFLHLFPSALLLQDVIRFSNLDAQTHQEPQKHNTRLHKRSGNLITSTHTHKWDAMPADSSVMPVTLAHAAQTYVVLTNVQSACRPSYGIHTPLTWLTNLIYCTAGMKLSEHLSARSSPVQHSVLSILLTSVTLPPRKY